MMLIFRGAAALSDFRVSRLSSQLAEQQIALQSCQTHYLYFVEVAKTLTAQQIEQLSQLFEANAVMSFPAMSEEENFLRGQIVIPRIGTISPW